MKKCTRASGQLEIELLKCNYCLNVILSLRPLLRLQTVTSSQRKLRKKSKEAGKVKGWDEERKGENEKILKREKVEERRNIYFVA